MLERADKLSAEFTADLGTRGLDILHVAAALAVDAQEFFTLDKRQQTLAAKAGLRVKPA